MCLCQIFAVGIAWPSQEISQDGEYDSSAKTSASYRTNHAPQTAWRNERVQYYTCADIRHCPRSIVVVISSSLALTAGLSELDKVHVFPINGAKNSAAGWLPSLKQVQEARYIRVQEVPITGSPRRHKNAVTSKPGDSEKGKRRDWLPLLVREALGKSFSSPLSLLPTTVVRHVVSSF